MTAPRLEYLYCYITNGCNLHCRHCWIEPQQLSTSHTIRYLDPQLFTFILDQAIPLGLRGVKLTGGEPLLHPSFGALLSILKERALELTVETNGILVTRRLATLLRGMSSCHLSVSLDGAREETHDRLRGEDGAFHRTIQGIRHLVEEGIKPEIIMTLMPGNIHELPDLVQLARRLGTQSVKVNCLQPVARGKHLHEEGESVPVKEIIALSHFIDREFADASFPVFVHVPPAFRPLGQLFGSRGDMCATCGILDILGVLADGSYALCGIGETVKDMVFGPAAHTSLKCVWEENETLWELRRGLPGRLTGICGQCIFKGLCRGGCLAQSFYRHHKLWGPFWFCEEAFHLGLFPETRRVASLKS